MIVGIDPRAVLSIPADQIGGKVFKAWPWNSDGIGDTMLDFSRARSDLFEGVPLPLTRERYSESNGSESGVGEMRNRYGRQADAVLSRYRVERRGAPGKDGRVDVVIDTRNGALVYAGQTYNYDPAAVNLQDAVQFVGGALAGYGLVTFLGGAVAGGAAAAAPASSSAVAGGSGWLDAAVAADLSASQAAAAAGIGQGAGWAAIEAAALAPIAVGGAAGAAAGATSALQTLGQKATGALVNSATKAGTNWLTASLSALLAGKGAGSDAGAETRETAAAVDQSEPMAWRPWMLVLVLAAGAAALA